jgi:TPR repeat protein
MTWPAAITDAIKNIELMLLVFSEAANSSPEVSKELTLASNHKRLVLPVRIENTAPSAELEYHLVNRHWLDVYGLETEAAIMSILESVLKNFHKAGDSPTIPMVSDASSASPKPSSQQPDVAVKPPLQRGFWSKFSPSHLIILAGICAACTFAFVILPSGEEKSSIPSSSSPVTAPALETAVETAPEKVEPKAVVASPEKAEPKDAASQYARALQLLNEYKYADALPLLTNAAEQGHVEAQIMLGNLLYSGAYRVAPSLEEAAKWYAEASQKNSSEAKNNLAIMYKQGLGVPKDIRQAFNLFNSAAEQGHAGACYNLGVLFELGEGTAQNKNTAEKWYRKAADSGHLEAIDKMFYLSIRSGESGIWASRMQEAVRLRRITPLDLLGPPR